MAAPKENLLSLFHQTSTEPNTFTKQKKRYVQRRSVFQDEFSMRQGQIRETQLQQRWLELKERECVAQQHNRQLLQQFEKAQDTLKEMLARNAAMKTIRMEYERYLEENTPRWHQQLQEKTLAAQKQKMEDYLRSYLNKTEEEGVSHSALGAPSLSQGLSTRPQKIVAPQAYSIHDYSDYNQDGSSQHPYVQSSWLTQTQSQIGRIPIRVPAQRHSSTLLPPPNFHPQSFPLPHPTSMPGHHHPQPRQEAAEWASPQYSNPCSWATGAAGTAPGSWGQLYTEEPPLESRVSQTGRGEHEPGREVSSKREKGSGSSSSCLSQELDIKPVRLPSGHAESSESGRDSSLTCREKRKKREKRGKTQHSSSDKERCGSKESSRTSSEIVIASVTVAKSSERETSSEDNSARSSRKTKRRGGLAVGSPRSETVAKEQTEVKHDDPEGHNEESQPVGKESGSSSEEEKLENQSDDGKSESCREEEEPGSESIKIDKEKQESSSSEQSSTEKKDEGGKENLGTRDEEENSQEKKVQKDNYDEEVSERENTTEVETGGEDEEDQGDGEQSKKMNEETESRKHGSASSQEEDIDVDGSESSEDKKEDEEGSKEEDGEDEEQHGSEHGEEESRDSEDSIISPQEKRSKQMQNIPEEAAEGDEEDITGSSKVSDEDDIENLLAPQEHTKKEEKDEKPDEKPKAICHNLDIFQVTEDKETKTDHRSDSDEFDDFYD